MFNHFLMLYNKIDKLFSWTYINCSNRKCYAAKQINNLNTRFFKKQHDFSVKPLVAKGNP